MSTSTTNRDMSDFFQRKARTYLKEAETAKEGLRDFLLGQAETALKNARHWETRPTCYRVTYYDAEKSRRGQGTQTAEFASLEAAKRFAATHQYRNRPCQVAVLEGAK